MADKQSREFIRHNEGEPTEVYVGQKRNPLTIELDVDVSEALKGLKALQREAKETTKALRELEAVQKKENAPIPYGDFLYSEYIDEVKRLAHDYKPLEINYKLYCAYEGGLRVKTVWVDRCCGATTSAIALSNVIPNTLFVVESEVLANDKRKRLGANNVVAYTELKRGSDLLRDNKVFIFDEVSDRTKLIGTLQTCFGEGHQIIKIRSTDYTD